MRLLARPFPTDNALVCATVALLAVGLLAVYDASYAQSLDLLRTGHDGLYFLKRQALWDALGFVAMLVVMRVDYRGLRRHAEWILLLSMALLVVVLYVPWLQVVANGAARWIRLRPTSLQFQPSEFAKLALVIYLAATLTRSTCNLKKLKRGLMPVLLPIGMVVILVERGPDLGTAAVIGVTAVTMLYLAGARPIHILGVIGCAVGAMVVMSLGHGYRWQRIQMWLHPEDFYLTTGYQIVHGLIAVATGGIQGNGLGAGIGKFYLPEANTDFIFATVAEEMGLWGGALLIGLVIFLGWRGCRISRIARDPFGSMLAAGITATICWQALLNVAVVTNSVPATGVPLPLVSYGGSSVLFKLIGIGILLNIAHQSETAGRKTGADFGNSGPAAQPTRAS